MSQIEPKHTTTFGKYLKTATACKKLFLKYFERGLPKSLKKVSLILSSESSFS